MKPATVLTRVLPCLGLLALASPAAADDPPPPSPPRRVMPLPPIRRPMLSPPLPAPGAAVAPAVPLAAAPTPASRPVRRPVARPKPPPPPAGPPPDVHLSLEAPTPHGAWTLRATNAGDVPVRLAADARLLSLDVTARGAARPVHCELPADLRPDDDLDRSLVLPPGRSYAETFEPRLYCFGEHALAALSPQAIVVARLGWPASSRAETRQAVSSIDGIEPVVASLPSIVSAPVALPDEPTPSPLPPAPQASAMEQPRLRVTSTVAVDAQTFGDLAITVTVHNDGTRPVRLRFKPETLAFDVTTSHGVERCNWPTPVGAPMRELFSTLRAGGSEMQQVMLSDYCSGKSFDQPGLVVVRAELDTRHADGRDVGLRTFDGQVIATDPTLVRLHKGTGGVHLAHPHLEPGPSSE